VRAQIEGCGGPVQLRTITAAPTAMVEKAGTAKRVQMHKQMNPNLHQADSYLRAAFSGVFSSTLPAQQLFDKAASALADAQDYLRALRRPSEGKSKETHRQAKSSIEGLQHFWRGREVRFSEAVGKFVKSFRDDLEWAFFGCESWEHSIGGQLWPKRGHPADREPANIKTNDMLNDANEKLNHRLPRLLEELKVELQRLPK